jgi:deoxyribonuclease V
MKRIPLELNRSLLARSPEDLSLQQAMKLQERFSRIVSRRSNQLGRIRLVTGLDSAYEGDQAFGAAVTLDYETMEPVETETTREEVRFPYVPGFLAFREAPVVIAAAKKLKRHPDVYLVDGHGYAHPRRFGLACHVGIALEAPTIGVAKSRLCGEVYGLKLKDRGKTIGAIVKRETGRPLHVSVGHKISLRDSVRIVSQCFRIRSKDPITLAHTHANIMRRTAS